MSEWTEKPLGTLCSIKTGKKDVNEGSPNGAYPFFTCSRDVHASDSYSFDTDAILIAGNGAVGDTKLYRGKFEAYQRTYVLDEFKEDLDFIFYILKGSLSEALRKVVSGSTMPYIRKGDLERFPIPLPPMPEQKKIAHILSTVQRAIEAQEQIIQITTELKKALMHKLFTEGLRNEPQKQTEIGPVPESWEVVQLGEFFRIKHGFAFDGKFFKPAGDYILMTPGHFHEEGGFRDQGEKTKFFTGDIPQDYVLAKDDLVVAMTEQKSGLLGSAAFVPEGNRYLHNQRLGLIVDLDTKRLSKRYLFHAFNLPHLRIEVAKTSTGSKVKHTSPTKLRAVKVGIPPTVAEQEEIASALSATQQKINVAANKKAQFQELFRTLLHELMTAKVRVHELDFSTGGHAQ